MRIPENNSRANCISTSVATAFLLVSVLLPFSGRGAGTVTNLNWLDLDAALSGGGAVTFACDGVIYKPYSAAITISGNVVIDGSGHQITLDGWSSWGGQMFNVASGGSLVLSNITIADCVATTNGAAIYNLGTVSAYNTVFTNNIAQGLSGTNGVNGVNGTTGNGGNGTAGTVGGPVFGGAIYNAGTLALNVCAFFNNETIGGQGGSGGNGGSAQSGHTPGNGGAGATGGLARGGAIFTTNQVAITNCTFLGNQAIGGQGGNGGNGGAGVGNVGNNGVAGAGLEGSGGALYIYKTATLVNSTLYQQLASGGSGGFDGLRLGAPANAAPIGGPGYGGAIYNAGTNNLINCTLYGNSAFGGNGGYEAIGTGGAGSNGFGGGIYSVSTIGITNTTISSCGAYGGTGGTGGTANGSNGTGQGGNLNRNAGIFALKNAIVAYASSGTNGVGTITDGGNNISSDNSINLAASGSLKNTDPLLNPLANNGGYTATCSLQPGSPAINAGVDSVAPKYDQRNYTRNGTSDIGACEYKGSTLEVYALGPVASLDGNVGLLMIDGLVSNAPSSFTVNLTISGTASNGGDYVFIQTNSVTIPTGSKYVNIPIWGIPGAFSGTNKSIVVTLGSGTNYFVTANDLFPSIATVTLYDHNTSDTTKRYIRGTSTAAEYQSFVVPLDFEMGVNLDAIGGNATNLFPANPWTTTLYHFNATNTTVVQTNSTGRIPFQNPIVAFGDTVGGSPLYLNQNYRFSVAAGTPLNLTNALRIQVYYRSNSAYAGTISLPIPDTTVSFQENQLVTNGFTATFSGFGLQTTLFISTAANYGLLFSPSYKLTHNATSAATNYYYVVEEQGYGPYNNLIVTASGAADWSKLYVMEFSPFPTSRSIFVDQPHFNGAPLPAIYQGKSLQELTNVLPTLPNLSSLVSSNYLAIDASPELRRHPILDQFVADMGNDPLALANYVINEIDLNDAIDYDTNYNSLPAIDLGGVNRSALATFQEGQGSPLEQCELLVYLLRQAGVPAAYVFPTNGGVQMLDFQLSKLLRVQLHGAMNELGQTNLPQLISVNYPWVAAYVGTNWVQIFPWIKDTEITEGFNFYDFMPTNYNSGYKWLRAFISNDTNIFSLSSSDQPLDLLPLFIQQNLNLNAPGLSVDDMGVQYVNRRHLYAQWSSFPEPFAVSGTPLVIESLSTNLNFFNTVEIMAFSQANPGRVVGTGEMRLADLHNRPMLLKFLQEGTNNVHDMILSLAPYAPTITNVFTFGARADSTWKLTSSNRLDSTDDGLVFQITHHRNRFLPSNFAQPPYYPHTNLWGFNYFEQGNQQRQTFVFTDYIFRKGDTVAWCVDYGKVSQKMLNVHAQTIWQFNQNYNTNQPADPDIYVGTVAYLLGMSYFNYSDRFNELNDRLHKVRVMSSYEHGYGLLRPLRDSTGALTNGGAVYPAIPAVHMPNNGQSFIFNASLHPDSGYNYGTAQSLNRWLQRGVQGSAAEHATLRSFYQRNAISSIKLLQQAGANMVELNPANYVAAGQVQHNGVALQNADAGLWNTITAFFTSGEADSEGFVTPGVVTNGTYVGTGGILFNFGEFNSPVGGLNGGFADAYGSSTFSSGNAGNITVNPAPEGSATSFQLYAGSLGNGIPFVNGATTPWTFGDTQNALANDQSQFNPTLSLNKDQYVAVSGSVVNNASFYAIDYDWGLVNSMGSFNSDKSSFVSEPVNVMTGEFYVDTTDLTLPGPMPLQIRRNYSSQNLAENEFGFGWKINYVPFLTVGTNSTLIYAAEMDGSCIIYRQTGTNANLWLPQPQDNPTLNNNSSVGVGSVGNLFNNRLQLSTVGGTNGYTLTGADGSTRNFTVRSYPTGGFNRQRPYLDVWRDNRGNSYTFQYGTDATQSDYGEVRRIQSSNGNFLGFYYDVYGHIIEAYTGDGRRLEYDYDQYGDLTAVTLPDESQINYVYQHANYVTNSVTNVYSTHLVYQEQKPDGRIVENFYDSQRRVTNQLMTVGVSLNPTLTAAFTYTNNFNISSPTNLLTGVTAVYDYTNNVSFYFYTNSLIRKTIDPLNGTVVQDWFETNAPGGFQRSLKSRIDQRGLQTTFAYDSSGNLTNTTVAGDLLGDGSTVNAITSATYNTNNLPLQIIDPVGNSVGFVYDTNYTFLPKQIIKFAGGTAISTNVRVYVNATNVVALGSTLGTNTAFGLLQREIRAFGTPDAATNDSFYTGQGFVTNSVQYTGTSDPNITNQFFYNERDELVQRTDGAGRNYLFAYDPMGRITAKETYEAGQTTPMDWLYYYYNENGEVNWIDGPRYNPEDYVFKDYDGGGRLSQEIHWQTQGKPDGSGVQAKTGYSLYATSFYQYDPLGDLTKVTDPLGNFSLKYYDPLGRALREEFYDANSVLLSTNGFAYNLAGDLTNAFNALGGRTQKIYTSAGKPKFQLNADGSTNAWRYYLDGRIRREIQRNGAYAETVYDDTNRITTRVFHSAAGTPLSTNISFFDRRGNVIKTVDAGGNVFTNLYDGLDRVKLSAGPPIVTIYEDCGLTGPGCGNFVTNVLQQRTGYIYDASGKTLTVTNAFGEKTVTTRDPIGRVLIVQTYASGASSPLRVTTNSYSADHHKITVAEGTGTNAISTTTYTDNDGHVVLTVHTPISGSTDYEFQTYDADGNRIELDQRSISGSTVTVWSTNSWTYDGLNRPKTQTALDGATTSFTYDSLGDLTSRAMPGNLAWTATYSSAGQILSERDSSSGQGTRTNTYSYYFAGSAFAGLLQTVTDGRGVSRASSYDDFLRLAGVNTSGSLPEQQISVTWQYDARSLLTNVVQSFASTNTGPTTAVRRTYDVYSQLNSESILLNGAGWGGTAQSWDAAGRRSQLSSGSWGMSFGYRADGLMTSVNDATFGYADNGLLIGRTNTSRSYTINQRDALGRPIQATTSVMFSTVMTESWTWRDDGMPTGYTATRSDFTDSRSFSYGAFNQRLTQETFKVSSTQGTTNTYTYDAGASGGLGVLTKATELSSVSNSWGGGLDSFSRVAAETNTVARRNAYGKINGKATVAAALDGRALGVAVIGTNGGQWRTAFDLTPGAHQLTATATTPSGFFTTNASAWFTNNAADRAADSYDANGQLAQRIWLNSSGQTNRVQTLVWDAFGRLVKVSELDSLNNGFNWQADFDPLGRRIRTTIVQITNNVAFTNQAYVTAHYYDPMVEFLEIGVQVNNNLTTWKTYGPDSDGRYGGQQGLGGLEELTTGFTTQGIIQDCFGNVIAGVTNGVVAWNPQRLNCYGPADGFTIPPLESSPLTAQSLAWRGKWRDVTGYFYWGARPYDSDKRAFLSFDMHGHAATAGGYMAFGGNPAFLFDADGRNPNAPYSPYATTGYRSTETFKTIQTGVWAGEAAFDAVWNSVMSAIFTPNPEGGLTPQQQQYMSQMIVNSPIGSPFAQMGGYPTTPTTDAFTKNLPVQLTPAFQDTMLAYGAKNGGTTFNQPAETRPTQWGAPIDPVYNSWVSDTRPNYINLNLNSQQNGQQQPIVTVLGSGRDVAQYANRPGFNVLQMPANITEPAMKDAYNAYWLMNAYTRGDSFWLVTDPAQHAQNLQNANLPPTASALFRVELPILNNLNNVNSVPAYMIQGGPPTIVP
jgi:YD repeat-containing protein